MSHGIMTEDKGVVWGATWHNMPQYIQQDTPVSLEQAREVLDYPIEKRPLFLIGDAGEEKPVDACCVIRTDTGRVLVPHTGLRFAPMNNTELLTTLDTRLLQSNKELMIESVGTLFGGATAFINVVLERYHVKGDESETLTRLLYMNPLGLGGYKVGVHNIRVVCNNTLRLAKAQAIANRTITMIPHTENAATKIADTLFVMSELLDQSKEFRDSVASLVDKPIRFQAELDALLSLLFPLPDNDEPDNELRAQATSCQGKLQARAEKLFNAGVEGIEPQFQRTRYSLLQACTYIVDHPETIRAGNDQAFITWDGIVGDRAAQKEHLLTVLLTAP